MNKTIHQLPFIECDCPYEDAKIIVFGAPFDGTTSFRAGTRFGPQALRSDSFGIESYSPYQDKDLTNASVCDVGDLELPFGNTKRVLNMIEEQTLAILQDKQIPFMIGGEHLVTLGAMRAINQCYENIHIIHFDAHADLRNDYLQEIYSHATVMRRCYELDQVKRIHQFGIRSGTKEEFDFARQHTDFHPFSLSAVSEVVASLGNMPVYVTIDLDVLDPSIFPGTGTPEAGGVMWQDLLRAILALRGTNIVACDVNELSPHYDQSGVSTAVAAKTIRELLLLLT